jgi:hypothetical protein
MSYWCEITAGTRGLAAEPGPQPVVTEARLDDCLSAMADFADLKSMWTTGHSRGVAEHAVAMVRAILRDATAR